MQKKAKLPDFRMGWEKSFSSRQSPIVQVTWLDASVKMGMGVQISSNWQDDYSEGILMEDVGYLLKQNAKWITLAADRNAQDNAGYRTITDIPRCAVCRVKVLSKGTKENVGFEVGLEDVITK